MYVNKYKTSAKRWQLKKSNINVTNKNYIRNKEFLQWAHPIE